MSRNGRPATGASTFGSSPMAPRRRVPSPPARITTSWSARAGGAIASDVGVDVVAQHREALGELDDAGIETERRAEAHRLDLLVRHDVVALVGILALLALEHVEVRDHL